MPYEDRPWADLNGRLHFATPGQEDMRLLLIEAFPNYPIYESIYSLPSPNLPFCLMFFFSIYHFLKCYITYIFI